MAFFVGAAAGRYRHMKSIICVSFMHNQTGRLYVLNDLSRIHNLGHKNGLIRVHFREFCFGFTFWDTKTAENVTLFVNRAAARKKEDPLPEGNRPPKRYGTGKRLSITLLRKAVLRMSGTASTLLRSQARACRSLHGVRPLQGSFRP